MTDERDFERQLRAALARQADAMPMRVDADSVRERLRPRSALPGWLVPFAAPVLAALAIGLVLLNAFPGAREAGLEAGSEPSDAFASPSSPAIPTADPTPAPTSHPAARGDAAVASVDGTLVLAGGARGTGELRSVVAFDGRVWTDLPPLPEERAGASAIVLPDGTLLVAGGRADGRPFSSALLLPAGATAWTEADPMPHPQAHMGSALVDGRAYFVGGSVPEHAAEVLVFDPATGAWTAAAPLPAPLSRVAATAVEGGMIVLGGRSEPDGADTSTALRYDAAADRWDQLPTMPATGSHLSAFAVDGRVWVIGVTPTVPARSRVLVYDIAAGEWSERETPEMGRAQVALLTRTGIIMVISTQPGIGVGSIDTREPPDR